MKEDFIAGYKARVETDLKEFHQIYRFAAERAWEEYKQNIENGK